MAGGFVVDLAFRGSAAARDGEDESAARDKTFVSKIDGLTEESVSMLHHLTSFRDGLRDVF